MYPSRKGGWAQTTKPPEGGFVGWITSLTD
jgi:hypothetical protein